jgi:hypothetical protein
MCSTPLILLEHNYVLKMIKISYLWLVLLLEDLGCFVVERLAVVLLEVLVLFF